MSLLYSIHFTNRFSSLHRFAYFPFFFFNDTATTEIYTLSLHDALPILECGTSRIAIRPALRPSSRSAVSSRPSRSEEHTSELQSPYDLVCRLLLEKKKKQR